MTSRDFCFWLQGYFEIGAEHEDRHGVAQSGGTMTPAQVACIKKHLALVFVHEIDPSMPNPKLDAIHAGRPHTIGGTGPNGEVLRC